MLVRRSTSSLRILLAIWILWSTAKPRFEFSFLVMGWLEDESGQLLHLWSLFFLSSLVGFGFLILWIILLVQTFQGKTMVLPVIGPIAQQQARN